MKLKKLLAFCICFFLSSNTQTSTQLIITPEYQPMIIDKTIVVKIFTKKVTHWADGQLITVFIKPINSIEHRDFVQHWLNMSNSRYKQELESQTYTGRAINVVEVDSDGEMLIKISSTIGSIGYVNYGLVVNSKQLKVISNVN
jgi:ABC-type phosphate transport system substrate-binding protein